MRNPFLQEEKQIMRRDRRSDAAYQREVDKLVERFTASWDLSNPPTGVTIATMLAGSNTSFSTDLLDSLQGLRLGGN